jgi:hypothetical protein
MASRPIAGTIFRRTVSWASSRTVHRAKALWRRRADQRDHLLGLLQVQRRSTARTRRVEQRPLRPASQIPLPDLPDGVARQADQ